MRIILVGAGGTIGSHVAEELEKRHEIIRASANRGPLKVDITSIGSIRSMYKFVGKFDAVICTAGKAFFGPMQQIKERDFYLGIKNKLMGQVNLVMAGRTRINAGGSFTLTSGILYRDPVVGSVSLSMVNNALHGFVRAAAIELNRDVRINAVSPELAEASVAQLGAFFPGHTPVSMPRIVQAYVKSVEGAGTGEIIEALG